MNTTALYIGHKVVGESTAPDKHLVAGTFRGMLWRHGKLDAFNIEDDTGKHSVCSRIIEVDGVRVTTLTFAGKVVQS